MNILILAIFAPAASLLIVGLLFLLYQYLLGLLGVRFSRLVNEIAPAIILLALFWLMIGASIAAIVNC